MWFEFKVNRERGVSFNSSITCGGPAIATLVMISSLILASFCLFAVGMSAKPLASGETATSSQGPLPLALGSPINVEKEDDCLVKVLAWEYAKKLLPRVSLSLLVKVSCVGLRDI